MVGWRGRRARRVRRARLASHGGQRGIGLDPRLGEIGGAQLLGADARADALQRALHEIVGERVARPGAKRPGIAAQSGSDPAQPF